jgi:hypothetical protein
MRLDDEGAAGTAASYVKAPMVRRTQMCAYVMGPMRDAIEPP